jgi:hydroxyacylglutathione hydrolase
MNPFLRLDAPGVAAELARRSPEAAAGGPAARFVALRRLRDAW